MIEKYYTPDIEEFHIGFEFEYNKPKFEDDNNWIPEVFTLESASNDLLCSYEEGKQEYNLRVKYLDREDIESLGFKTIYSVQSDFYKSIYSNEICRIRTITQSIITVCISVKNQFYMPEVFRGEIKNKSELSRLLKQLGIK